MINFQDYLNPNKGARNQALYGQFGMDPKGNNEVGAWARRLSQGVGLGAAQQVANWTNNTVPWGINTANYLQSWLSPGTRQARIQNQAGMINAQGRRSGDIAAQQILGQGGTQDQALALRAAALGRAQDASNQLVSTDLERLAQEQAALAPLISQLGGLSGLEPLLALGQFNEMRYRQNAQDKAQGGLGGLFGSLGGILGNALPMPKPAQQSPYSVIWGDM